GMTFHPRDVTVKSSASANNRTGFFSCANAGVKPRAPSATNDNSKRVIGKSECGAKRGRKQIVTGGRMLVKDWTIGRIANLLRPCVSHSEEKVLAEGVP